MVLYVQTDVGKDFLYLCSNKECCRQGLRVCERHGGRRLCKRDCGWAEITYSTEHNTNHPYLAHVSLGYLPNKNTMIMPLNSIQVVASHRQCSILKDASDGLATIPRILMACVNLKSVYCYSACSVIGSVSHSVAKFGIMTAKNGSV